MKNEEATSDDKEAADILFETFKKMFAIEESLTTAKQERLGKMMGGGGRRQKCAG